MLSQWGGTVNHRRDVSLCDALRREDGSEISDVAEPFRGYHDIGGRPAGPVLIEDRPQKPWEKLGEGVRVALQNKADIVSLDELRRGFEGFGDELYSTLGFYERRAEALTIILDEKGIIARADLEARMVEIARRRGQQVDFDRRTLR